MEIFFKILYFNFLRSFFKGRKPKYYGNFMTVLLLNFYPDRAIFGEGNGTLLQYSYLETPTDRGAWQAAVHGVEKSRTRDTTERLHFHFSLSCIGEGNGNPLQCSCLENPRDGGA